MLQAMGNPQFQSEISQETGNVLIPLKFDPTIVKSSMQYKGLRNSTEQLHTFSILWMLGQLSRSTQVYPEPCGTVLCRSGDSASSIHLFNCIMKYEYKET